MRLRNHTARTTKEVFDEYSSGDDYGFTKTVVPVRLAQYGEDKLVARSQARRVLARVELFRTVLFDFSDVEAIGPAFTDEMFRVFATQHPEIQLTSIHANPETERMIARARRGAGNSLWQNPGERRSAGLWPASLPAGERTPAATDPDGVVPTETPGSGEGVRSARFSRSRAAPTGRTGPARGRRSDADQRD